MNRPNEMECECANWARDGQPFYQKHHVNCKHHQPDTDSRELIAALLRGMEAWASDEDGIHPEAWIAYCDAKILIGEKIETGCA